MIVDPISPGLRFSASSADPPNPHLALLWLTGAGAGLLKTPGTLAPTLNLRAASLIQHV